MKIFSWISCGLFAVSTAVAYIPPSKIEIETVYAPPDREQSPRASNGDTVGVHYTGTLHKTGAKFDSSLDRGKPLSFELGKGKVIKGWDLGIHDMCVNEKRKLTIPSDLAYGSVGFSTLIPPDSALVFEVELVSLQSKSRDEL